MIERRVCVGLVVLTLLSCGRGDKAAAAVSENSPASGVRGAPVGRGPTAAILGRWNPPADSSVYGFADVAALLRTELIQRIQSSAMLLAEGSLSKDATNCVMQWTRAVHEVAVGGNDQEQLAVITYDRAALKAPVSVCIHAFGRLQPTKVANTKEAYEVKSGVLAVLPDALVVGSRALVEASLSKANKSTWPKDLYLTNDRQLVFVAKNAREQLDISGYVSVTKSLFAAHTDVTFPTEDAAKAMAESVAPAKIKQDFLDQSPMGDERLRDKLLEHWRVKQKQRSVAFEFSTKGSPDEMAQQLGLVSAISIFGVRKYLANAKTEEARRNVRAIAEHVIASHPKKLVSLPPVPKQFEALQGRKYDSQAEDWSAWKAIDFSLSEPQYYQYRIEASKDGKSALIIAEGDLDGDNQRSLFSTFIKLDPKTHTITAAQSIEERDPLE